MGSSTEKGNREYLEYIRNGFVNDIDEILEPNRYGKNGELARRAAEDRLIAAFGHLFQKKEFPIDLLGGRLAVGAGRLVWYLGVEPSGGKILADGVCSWLYWRGDGGYRTHAKAYRNERARLNSLFAPGGEGNALMIAAGLGDLRVMPWSIVLLGENLAARSRRIAEWLYRKVAFMDVSEQLQSIRWRDPAGIYEAYYIPVLPDKRK